MAPQVNNLLLKSNHFLGLCFPVLFQHVRLHFDFIDIDATESCGTDKLQIHDFDSNGIGYKVEEHCSNQAPEDYVSKSFAVQLVFRSDGFAGGRGFNVTYSTQSSDSKKSFFFFAS